MNGNQLMGLLSISFLFLPVLLLMLFRLYVNRSLLFLGIYCLITALYNLMGEGFWPVPAAVVEVFAAVNNYLDTPIMGVVFLLYCGTPRKKRLLLACMGLFVVYELVILWRFGLRPASSQYIIGPGIALVFSLGLYFFITQLKKTLFYGKWLGRTLIATAIVFAYGCYGLIYYFYYIRWTPYVDDVFLLYFITALVFSILLSIALVSMYRKHRRIKEVQQVRRELALFFNTP